MVFGQIFGVNKGKYSQNQQFQVIFDKRSFIYLFIQFCLKIFIDIWFKIDDLIDADGWLATISFLGLTPLVKLICLKNLFLEELTFVWLNFQMSKRDFP